MYEYSDVYFVYCLNRSTTEPFDPKDQAYKTSKDQAHKYPKDQAHKYPKDQTHKHPEDQNYTRMKHHYSKDQPHIEKQNAKILNVMSADFTMS